MPVRRSVPETHGIYFITFTCCGWLPLFEETNCYDTIYKWFDHLKTNRNFILGYVIMPNHLHVLVEFNTNKKINTIVSNGKRFLAYEIVKRLALMNKLQTLLELQSVLTSKERRKGSHHRVFEPSFDWKKCDSEFLVEQKLRYMHENPCKRREPLVLLPDDYVHSSSLFYSTGKHSAYDVLHYKEAGRGEVDL